MNAMKLLRPFLLLSLLKIAPPTKSQITILPNAYAHNDYWHKRPLFDALKSGFTYVEADVFLLNNELVVAHNLPYLRKKKTLEQLYLKPLLEYTDTETDREGYPITLMIDIKSAPTKTYSALLTLLEKYKSMLTTCEKGVLYKRSVTVVITGHKPFGLINTLDARLVFEDEDLRKTGRECGENLYPIASCKYSRLIKWKGKGMMPEEERKQLKQFVAKAHANGRKVRLWASPENKTVWSALLQCNVDLINTNKLEKLKNFLISKQALLANAR